MKVKIDIDCTPEEARRFLGLPDLTPVHDLYLDKMKELCAEVGEMSGHEDFRYAEGFRKHLHLGFCDPDDDPLRAALKGFVAP